MDKVFNTNLSNSKYYPILMYKANKLIQVNFYYKRFGTSNKTGTLFLFNNNVYTDYDIAGLHINQIGSDYYLTINQATYYNFTIINPDGNVYQDGNYFIETDFSLLEDIKVVNENRTNTIEALFNSFYSQVAPIESYDLTGVTEETTHLIYKNTGNNCKTILLKIGERKSSGIRAWGLYLIVVKGATSGASTSITTTLIEGDETNKDYDIVQSGQNINLVMTPTSATRYMFEIIK